MNAIYKTQYRAMRKVLGIENIISIRFSNTKSVTYRRYRDTACTALARSFKNNVSTYIDRGEGQLCPGGNYFLGITHPSKKELCDVYVKGERVFQNSTACLSFLNAVPAYPTEAKKRYILFTPLEKEVRRPAVVALLATPAQAGRIFGLSIYKKMSYPTVGSGLPTCASIYAPIASHKIHINFIDYYDRYYQGKQNGRLIWEDRRLIISMPFDIFRDIVAHIPLSAHGSYKPNVKPQKVDPLRR